MVFFFHMEVASDSFSFLIYSSWLLVFILGVFYLFLSGFNSYCWKGIHFSQNLDSCLALTSQLQKPSNENVGSSLTRMLVHYLIREYTVNIPSYVLSGCDQDSNNVQRFSLDSNLDIIFSFQEASVRFDSNGEILVFSFRSHGGCQLIGPKVAKFLDR